MDAQRSKNELNLNFAPLYALFCRAHISGVLPAVESKKTENKTTCWVTWRENWANNKRQPNSGSLFLVYDSKITLQQTFIRFPMGMFWHRMLNFQFLQLFFPPRLWNSLVEIHCLSTKMHLSPKILQRTENLNDLFKHRDKVYNSL